MTKADIINKIAETTGLPKKDVAVVANAPEAFAAAFTPRVRLGAGIS